jgi:hypothetical protein
MKQQIALMAMLLISQNGSTTNLDIKEALRKQFDDGTGSKYRITQADVSHAMNDIAKEQGLVFTIGIAPNGAEYRIWALPTPATLDTDTDDVTDTDTTDSTSGDDLLKTAATSLTVGQDGQLSQSPAAPTTTPDSLPAGFGEQLDPALGEVTAYWSKDNKVRMQGNDKKTIVKEMLGLLKADNPGLKYDDIRVCSTAFYNKSVAGR